MILFLFGLHPLPGKSSLKLEWEVRQNICVGIAKGLEFLHEGRKPMSIGWLHAARKFLRVNHGFLLSLVTKEFLAVRAAAFLRTSMSSDVSAMFQIRWNFDFHRLGNALMLLRMVTSRIMKLICYVSVCVSPTRR